MSHTVVAIPALNDNYIWAIMHPATKKCVVVDPGDATPVISTLKQHQLSLAAILITHHHWDHTHGIGELLATYGDSIPVYAPTKDNVKHTSFSVQEGDTITIADCELNCKVIEIPGHTLGHVAYITPDSVFTGDTLFAAGCGRLFEGTPQQMYDSLSRLAALPATTKVYCGHEYTLQNLKFAAMIEPTNNDIKHEQHDSERLREQNHPTLPSTIGQERRTNPFLRCNSPAIQAAVSHQFGQNLTDEVAVFAGLRRWKDTF